MRLYLTFGFVSLLVLLALAITSIDGWAKKLGRDWKRLHRFAYPFAAVALRHFHIQVKLNVSEPVFVYGLFVWLMAWPALPETWRRHRSLAVTQHRCIAASHRDAASSPLGWSSAGMPEHQDRSVARAACERNHRAGLAAGALDHRRHRRTDANDYCAPPGPYPFGSASACLTSSLVTLSASAPRGLLAKA
jgi:hypothetical protein